MTKANIRGQCTTTQPQHILQHTNDGLTLNELPCCIPATPAGQELVFGWDADPMDFPKPSPV